MGESEVSIIASRAQEKSPSKWTHVCVDPLDLPGGGAVEAGGGVVKHEERDEDDAEVRESCSSPERMTSGEVCNKECQSAQLTRTVKHEGDGADDVEAHGQELVPLARKLVVWNQPAGKEQRTRAVQL